MTGPGKDTKPGKQNDAKSKKKPAVPVEGDEYEDGDIATPKHDRTDNDDVPL